MIPFFWVMKNDKFCRHKQNNDNNNTKWDVTCKKRNNNKDSINNRHL